MANLIGSIWAGLVPTVIALAVYFCIADVILLAQCLYYNYSNAQKAQKDPLNGQHPNGGVSDDPTQPLLRRRSSAGPRNSATHSPPLPTMAKEPSMLRVCLKNAVAILALCFLGSLCWVLAWQFELWQPTSTGDGSSESDRIPGAEVLGYISAILYLG